MSDIDEADIRRLGSSLLLIFRELLRQRRTTAVADRLGLSQSAVSHALSRLRTIFNDPLFLRRPNGLEPTIRALDLAPRIEEIVSLTQDVLGLTLRFDPATSRRHFRVSAPDFVSIYLAAPLLRVFERDAPLASFSLSFVGTEVFPTMRRGDIDLALIGGNSVLTEEGFRIEPVFTDHYQVVIRRDHPLARRKISRDVYQQLGHVMIAVSGGTIGAAENEIVRKGVKRRVVATMPRFMTALAVVGESDAIATVPAGLARRYAKAFGLKTVPLPFHIEPLSILSVRSAQARPDPAVDWLHERVRKIVRA